MESRARTDMMDKMEATVVTDRSSRARSHTNHASSAPQDLQETRELQDRRDRVDQRVSQERVARTETRVHLDSRVRLDFRAHRDLPDPRDRKDSPDDSSKSMDPLVPKDPLDLQAPWERKESPAKMEPTLVVWLAHQETTEIPDLLDSPDPSDLPAHLDHLESLAVANTALRLVLHLATKWLTAAVIRANNDLNKSGQIT